MSETDKIKERYIRRDTAAANRVPWDDFALLAVHERRYRILASLRTLFANRDIATLRAIDIGCGGGGSLLQLIELGLEPQNLVGVELTDHRAQEARNRLPAATHVILGDAVTAEVPVGLYDIVQQSTVFTSILDDAVQQALAQRMWDLLAPGGTIFWYDFIMDNPRNPHVRGVSTRRIAQLFPVGKLTIRRTTLAPPLGRPAAKIAHALYWCLWALPFLRSHVFVTIQKPRT